MLKDNKNFNYNNSTILRFESPPEDTRPGRIDKMNYKEMWTEERIWLNRSIGYLEQLILGASNNERMRLLGKLEGFKTVLGHMNDTERLRSNI